MTTGTGATSAFLAAQAMHFPSSQDGATEGISPSADQGSERGTAPTPPEFRMTDEEREGAIDRAGRAMQAWYSHYRQTRRPEYLENARHAMEIMCRLIAQRSPEYVAKLEAERGLDLPACANEEGGKFA